VHHQPAYLDAAAPELRMQLYRLQYRQALGGQDDDECRLAGIAKGIPETGKALSAPVQQLANPALAGFGGFSRRPGSTEQTLPLFLIAASHSAQNGGKTV